jgi:hypothetical protein
MQANYSLAWKMFKGRLDFSVFELFTTPFTFSSQMFSIFNGNIQNLPDQSYLWESDFTDSFSNMRPENDPLFSPTKITLPSNL